VSDRIDDRAARLKADFDEAFAQPPRLQTHAREAFLAITVAGRPWAVRLAEIKLLLPQNRVTPVPTPIAALRGITSVRGALFPVYDLARLLNQGPGGDCPWLILAGQIALAFDLFRGHLVPEAYQVVWSAPQGQVQGMVDGQPILHLPSVEHTVRVQVV
jgi:chemotaxis signal transduction protein